MIFYLSPGTPATLSGGTRKLYDHVAILKARGFDARIIYNGDARRIAFSDDDVVLIPEVYGDGIRTFIAPGVRRVVFVQNPYLTDRVDGLTIVADPAAHPYLTTPEIEAILTESAHTTDLLAARFPDLAVPLLRTHSSGNGRNGDDAGFSYGAWPRERRIVYFDYKHEHVNRAIFDGLDLPDGWSAQSMTGMTDPEVQDTLRSAAIFAAANQHEGMCAPTSEAMISGTVIVCWTGQGPDEYLYDDGTPRGVIATQDDVEMLRRAIECAARSIDTDPEVWAARTREWSAWFQATYSRERECDEICRIWTDLGQRAA